MTGTLTGYGKLLPRLRFENMLAEQGPRFETLRALEREIELMGRADGLEKKERVPDGSSRSCQRSCEEVAKSASLR